MPLTGENVEKMFLKLYKFFVILCFLVLQRNIICQCLKPAILKCCNLSDKFPVFFIFQFFNCLWCLCVKLQNLEFLRVLPRQHSKPLKPHRQCHIYLYAHFFIINNVLHHNSFFKWVLFYNIYGYLSLSPTSCRAFCLRRQ